MRLTGSRASWRRGRACRSATPSSRRALHSRAGASCNRPKGSGLCLLVCALAAQGCGAQARKLSRLAPRPTPWLLPLAPKLQEQHFQLQAQLARVEGEAEAIHWQATQAAQATAQLAGMVAAAANSSGGEAMDADQPAGQPAGGAPQQAQQQAQQAQRQASLQSSEAGSAVGSAVQSHSHNNSVGNFADAGAGVGEKDCHASSQLPEGVAAAALAEVLVRPEQGGPAGFPAMYGAPPPHETFDELLARFQAQVGGGQLRRACVAAVAAAKTHTRSRRAAGGARWGALPTFRLAIHPCFSSLASLGRR